MVATYSRDDLRAGRADWIANPSTGTSPGVKVRYLLSAERYFFLPQLGVLIEGATVEGHTAHLQAGLFRSG